MLNCLTSDLSTRVLNFANLTQQHIPAKGTYCIMPDRLIYKNLGSLNRALGRVIKVEGRTIFIKFTSGRVVSRAMSDIVVCSKNKHDEIVVDILDLPLWSEPGENLPPSSSQHDIFLPEINLDMLEEDNNVHNGNEALDFNSGEQIQSTADTNVSETENEEPEAETGHLRHSARQPKLSYKFLSYLADTDSEEEQ